MFKIIHLPTAIFVMSTNCHSEVQFSLRELAEKALDRYTIYKTHRDQFMIYRKPWYPPYDYKHQSPTPELKHLFEVIEV